LPEQELLLRFGKLLHQADYGLEQMIQMPWSSLGYAKGQVEQTIAQRASNCMQGIGQGSQDVDGCGGREPGHRMDQM
jgi:hypothetical protein